MKKIVLFLVIGSLFGFGKGNAQESNDSSSDQLESVEDMSWNVGTYFVDDYPVIMKFLNVLPEKEKMSKMPFLTVISWNYDGSSNNGMPQATINDRMITLEDAIENSLSSSEVAQHVYSRTGNNLKELVYYCNNQPDFMAMLNKTLEGHDEYPIEIKFYPDKEWSDFNRLRSSFTE